MSRGDGSTGTSFFPLSALEVSFGAFPFINQKVAIRWRRMTSYLKISCIQISWTWVRKNSFPREE